MADLHLLSPRGFRAGGVHAGIKRRHTNDVGLLVANAPAVAAAVFTTNRVFAAPVKIGRQHIAAGKLRAVVVNSGNANACTGARGERDARRMCTLAAQAIGCAASEILPSSTGIIGHHLPMDKVERGILAAAKNLGASAEHALAFTDAILTTDTKRKFAAARLRIDSETVTIAGICKGAGMIGPRMSLQGPPQATMLAYLTTDARIAAPALRKLLADAAEQSFNAVTIDDHTSTNDTVVLLASGLSAKIATAARMKKFTAALDEVCQSLGYQIAADGEGATKVVKIVVTGLRTNQEAQTIARAIANSPLVKCAMHGNDPNWGRIVSAAGMCGVMFDPARAVLTLQGTLVFRRGQPATFNPDKVSKALEAPEVVVKLTCGTGKGMATLWTCDLSKEYVTINADYHT